MAAVSVTYTFTAATAAVAAEVNTNFTDLVTYINNRNTGTAWDALTVSGGASSLTYASGVPLTVNNGAGTSNILQAQDNGTNVFVVADGGIWTSVNQSGVRVYASGNVTLGASGATTITFDTETFDVKSEFNTSTYTFTATAAGKYFVSFTAEIGLTNLVDQDTYILRILKNGSIAARKQLSISGGASVQADTVSDLIDLAATDTISFVIYNNNAGSRVMDGGATISYASIHKVA